MNTSNEAAANNEVTRLTTQQQSWTEKRAQLVRTIADVKANAGASALAGTSTSKMADQVSRLHAEVEITDQALATLASQMEHAKAAVTLARIDDTRRRVVELSHEAQAAVAAAKPHLDALEVLEGVRYAHPRSKVAGLELDLNRQVLFAEHLEHRLPDAVRAEVMLQRETVPSELDRAIYAIQYPHAVQEETPV